MKLAIAQVGAYRGNPAANVTATRARISEAAADGCSLVVFPECGLSGYMFDDRADLSAAALDRAGPEIEAIIDACRTDAIHAVVGLFERDGDKVYNTALLIGPSGILGAHRKRHLPLLGGDRFADKPDGIETAVFATQIGTIGLAICYEIRFPEVIRTLALGGADIVVLPTNWPVASHILADLFTRVRAAENFVYFLVANRNDTEEGTAFLGSSQIVDPSGAVLVHAGTETGIFSAEVDIELARDKTIVFEAGRFEVTPFKDRLPETYRL